MAVRCLRSKLSERIFTHVLQDARIMPHRLVKGLPPLASEETKIAPLARHSAIGSTMPIKNLMFQSFKSKAPESMPFGFLPNAKNVLLYNEAGYNLSSSFKGKSSPIWIHGRNFSSCPPGTKNIHKMDSDNKGSSGAGTERIFVVEGPDSSRSRRELLKKIIKVYTVVFVPTYFVWFYYTVWDTLCSNPFLFFSTVGGHILCLLLMLWGLLGM